MTRAWRLTDWLSTAALMLVAALCLWLVLVVT